jgi:hypothetical protein
MITIRARGDNKRNALPNLRPSPLACGHSHVDPLPRFPFPLGAAPHGTRPSVPHLSLSRRRPPDRISIRIVGARQHVGRCVTCNGNGQHTHTQPRANKAARPPLARSHHVKWGGWPGQSKNAEWDG